MQEEVKGKKGNVFSKYKWLYLIVAAVAALVFGFLMLFLKDFRNSVVYYITGAFLIVFVLVRLIPFFKTERNRYALLINVLEMIIDLGIGVALIVITVQKGGEENSLYPFLLGGVIYLRGFIYLVEITFLKTKMQPLLFFIHVAAITLGSVIIALGLQSDTIGYVIAVLFLCAGIFAVVDGSINFNRFRNEYIVPKKALKKEQQKQKEQEEVEKGEATKTPEVEENNEEKPEVIIPNEEDKQDQDYVS